MKLLVTGAGRGEPGTAAQTPAAQTQLVAKVGMQGVRTSGACCNLVMMDDESFTWREELYRTPHYCALEHTVCTCHCWRCPSVLIRDCSRPSDALLLCMTATGAACGP